MKCFLLELRVISLEFKHHVLNETVENLIFLANDRLSSNGVSFPIVGWSFDAFGVGWEKSLAGYKEQADPWERELMPAQWPPSLACTQS